MLPGESYKSRDNYGVTLFTEPPNEIKMVFGRLELNSPHFETPEFGDGPHRNIYSGTLSSLN